MTQKILFLVRKLRAASIMKSMTYFKWNLDLNSQFIYCKAYEICEQQIRGKPVYMYVCIYLCISVCMSWHVSMYLKRLQFQFNINFLD